LNPRINSTLPHYPLIHTTCRLTRKHSRVSLIAAAALAAGAFGAVATDMAPQAEAAVNAAPSAHSTTTQLDSLTVPGMGGAATAPAGDVPKASEWATGLSRTQAAAEQSPAAHTLMAHALATHPLAVQLPTAQATTAPGVAAQGVAGHANAANTPTASAPTAQATAAHGAVAAPAVDAKGQAAPAQPAKPKTTPAHAAPSHAAQAHPAAAHPAASHPASAAPPVKPFVIYDSVTPSSIPGGQQVATYANGAYAQSAASMSGRGHVLWIDTNGSDPRADVLDVEPGDATPSGAAQWVKARLSSQPHAVAIVYTMLSDWQAVKGYVGRLPIRMQANVRYWIADPTGVAHVVPGSNATQWYWGQNYDISTANPGFESS